MFFEGAVANILMKSTGIYYYFVGCVSDTQVETFLLVICSPTIIFCHYRDIISTALRLFDELVWRLNFQYLKN